MDNSILHQQTDNGKQSAAVPQLFQQPNTTRLWSTEATKAIAALIDFRSAIHRWQAAGTVSDDEFITELERLEDAHLQGFVDELIGLAVALDFQRLLAQRQMPGRLARRRWLASAAGLIVIGHELVGKELARMLRGAK